MSHRYTDEDIDKLTSIFANEPFDYAFDQGGHVPYWIEKNKIDDPVLRKLVARYMAASKKLKAYLRHLGVEEIS